MADEQKPDEQSPLPLNPDFAGYPTLEAFRNGYRASGEEAKRLREENQKKDAVIAQLLTNGESANQRRSVPDRNARPEDRLTEFGVPVDAINELVDQRLHSALAPITRGIQARGAIVSEHPDYVQFENEVAQFINADPVLSQSYPKMFEADPVSAMEYAFLKFGESRRRAVGAPEGAERNGMADAAIPGTRQGDGRHVPSQELAIQEALDRFQKTGSSRDAQNYAKTRLGPVLKEQFRRQGQEL